MSSGKYKSAQCLLHLNEQSKRYRYNGKLVDTLQDKMYIQLVSTRLKRTLSVKGLILQIAELLKEVIASRSHMTEKRNEYKIALVEMI